MLLFEKVLNFFNVQLSIKRVKPKKSAGLPVRNVNFDDIFTSIKLKDYQVLDVEKIGALALEIPGMIDLKAGQFLFMMCYLQEESGDVVEIGSWQGRSTSFLARAVQLSKNGKMYAIDPFTGNVGKESFYVVEKQDLSDLKDNFLRNMTMLGVSDSVTLLPMKSRPASEKLGGSKVRFLFIDGDHTEEGVRTDLECFFPLLAKGGIVVFDDFLQYADGLIKAVEAHIHNHKPKKIFSFKKTLVLKY